MKKIYLLLLAMFPTLALYPQSGVLDPSFGNDGIVTTVITGSYNLGQASVVQPDGKIIVAGEAGEPSPFKVAIARYNPDGTLDTSFGSGGTLLIQVGPAKSYARNLALQPDGKIVVGAYTYDDVAGDFAVLRLNADGTPDSSFGTNGMTIVDNGSHEVVDAMAIAADGKIVLAGNDYTNFLATRFNTDGSLDTTFGSNGWAAIAFADSDSQVKDIVFQNDGKLILAGFSFNLSLGRYSMAAAKLNEDGSLDPSFGTDGQIAFNIGTSDDYAVAVAIQTDEKIVLGGYLYVGTNPMRYDLAAVRLNTDGTFDTTYGNNGIAINRVIDDGQNYTENMLLQADDKVVLAGYAAGTADHNLIMLRFDSDGNVDTSFGANGKVNTDLDGRPDFGKAISIQPDDKIILAGYSYATSGVGEIVVARYDNNVLGTTDFQNNEFLLYPNPANDHITIALGDTSPKYEIGIYDVLGKKLLSSEIAKTGNIDVSAFAPGTYLVKVNSHNNTSIIRFIKQ